MVENEYVEIQMAQFTSDEMRDAAKKAIERIKSSMPSDIYKEFITKNTVFIDIDVKNRKHSFTISDYDENSFASFSMGVIMSFITMGFKVLVREVQESQKEEP